MLLLAYLRPITSPTESYGIPQFVFLNSCVCAIYTKLSHSIAENLQISGLQKGLCNPDYLVKAQALISHLQLQKVSSLCGEQVWISQR